FLDLAGHWAQREVMAAASLGIIQGYPDGTFRPGRQVSRAELATILHRVILGRDVSPPAPPATFADIETIPAWALDAAQAARQYALMQGRDGRNFVPSAEATRAEAAVTLMRTALLLASASISSVMPTR
ncbi:S-layer homology domain-containing protein, partial [Paenibacillus sp. 598K]|uniref:S-layer homology domain-containing protein n=1 Tax=Paenibacillus sp. 598K TaxID=1117987 RepID=UPI0011CFBD09